MSHLTERETELRERLLMELSAESGRVSTKAVKFRQKAAEASDPIKRRKARLEFVRINGEAEGWKEIANKMRTAGTKEALDLLRDTIIPKLKPPMVAHVPFVRDLFFIHSRLLAYEEALELSELLKAKKEI
jgi:hypothetical protein